VDKLQELERRVRKRNYDSPPLHLWHPALSGDIAIRIAGDGTWYHESKAIMRESLVRLFASILRREEDGEYYLVTPNEKWRIAVELHPLMVTDVSPVRGEDTTRLRATLNTGKCIDIGKEHPLFLEDSLGGIPVVELEHGLTALFTRAAWYRLANSAQERDGQAALVIGDYEFKF
jgi:hypothetical protein